MAVAARGGGVQDIRSIVLSSNKDGMEALRKEQSRAAFEQFKHAEALLIANQSDGGAHASLLAVTCNNLGCYYKKVGKLHGALSYFRRALQLEIDLGTDEVTVAGTHLNLCAILSKLEKHDKAVQHAMCALELITKHVHSSDPEKVSTDDYSVLAIAYHNVAVERDYLQQYDKSAAAFQQGHAVALSRLGEEHPLAIALGKNHSQAEQKVGKGARTAPGGLSMRKVGAQEVGPLAVELDLPNIVEDVPAEEETTSSTLPAVRGASKGGAEDTSAISTRNVRQDAMDWVADANSAWKSFAHTTLTGRSLDRPAASTPQQLRSKLLDRDVKTPAPSRPTPPASSVLKQKKGSLDDTGPVLIKGVDERAQAVKDIIDVHWANGRRMDYRPNRIVKNFKRTTHVLTAGVAKSEKYRDLVIMPPPSKSALAKNEYIRQMAAERIQRSWRAFYHYCRVNAAWMIKSYNAALIIQDGWRKYDARKRWRHAAAVELQRHTRGKLVRMRIKNRAAAIVIQRRFFGVTVRKQCRLRNAQAVKLQALMRGFIHKRRFLKMMEAKNLAALRIQSIERQKQAKRTAETLRCEREQRIQQQEAARSIQRLHRGNKAREDVRAVRERRLEEERAEQAAVGIQCAARSRVARRECESRREQKRAQEEQAATRIQTCRRSAVQRAEFKEYKKQLESYPEQVVMIQAHGRGFVCRRQLRREEYVQKLQTWAALSIQRLWRGYLGRVKWEDKYEEMWRREMSAAMIQRNIRGWVARACVGRRRRRLARAEFERARDRFRAAAKIQALIRGVLVRKIVRREAWRKNRNATVIQRHMRGMLWRKRLWRMVKNLRATILQARMRGYMVRKRRDHLEAMVIFIQRRFRLFRGLSPRMKERLRRERMLRRDAATAIQRAMRSRKH